MRPTLPGCPALARAALLRAGLGLWALALCQGCFLKHLYLEDLPAEAELVSATTDDGWRIGLMRYRAEGGTRGLPVMLVHGVVNNARTMDLDARHSLARWFASQGRETFLINLRGTVYSDRPDEAAGRPATYTVDTYVHQDLAAAIAFIRQSTGAPGVDVVGHSMGGNLVFIYLALGLKGMNAAATMGAGARFDHLGPVEEKSSRFIMQLGQSMGATAPAPEIVHSIAPIHGEIEGPFEAVGRQAANVSTLTWKKFMANGVDYASRTVFAQLESWLDYNAMVSADGSIDYSERLREVRTPVLVVGAKLDWMAPLHQVRPAYDLLGGPKELFIPGEENGFEHDYGHGDMIMADRASEELWPHLKQFFDRHAPEKQAVGCRP